MIEVTPTKIITEAVKGWFVMKSKNGNRYDRFSKDITPSEKKELMASRKTDLKNYIIAKLVEKLKMTPEKIAENDELIERFMPPDFDDDDFEYEGGRRCRKTKRSTKKKKRSYRKRSVKH